MMNALGILLLAGSVGVVLYAFVGYPLLLYAALPFCDASRRPPPRTPPDEDELPLLTVALPVHNEEAQIDETLESLLALDYPESRRQILVVSDASTDGTDQRVRAYRERGVELLRMSSRQGKTAAENAARSRIRGDLVLNTDASIRVDPAAPRRLAAHFADPDVGVASGRDVSVTRDRAVDVNAGESGYVGYEMWVRDLESRTGGIVGASGCLYVARRDIQMEGMPDGLSRDFAAALTAHERGYRSVSVPDAVCAVPRAPSLPTEFRRKVRTITRGMGTLLYKRHLLRPSRGGLFAWKLLSHKVARWLVPWAGVAGVTGLALLSVEMVWARGMLGAAGVVGGLAGLGWIWPEDRRAPRMVSFPAYFMASMLAVLVATVRTVRGRLDPVWEPTRRAAVEGGSGQGDKP